MIIIVLGHSMFLHRLFVDEAGREPMPQGNWIDVVYDLMTDIRMPLFTIISGFVYALRPAVKGRLGSFFSGKARRLLVPLAVLSVVEYFYQHARIEAAVEPVLSFPKNFVEFCAVPVTHLWFIYAVFILFAVIGLLDWAGAMKSVRGWLVVFVLACAGYFIAPERWGTTELFGHDVPNYFAYASAMYLAPFFVYGVGLSRFPQLRSSRWLRVIAGIVLAIRIAYPLVDQRDGYPEWLGDALAISCGLATLHLLLSLPWSWRPLSWLGGFSYGIYLFHGLAIFAAFRICSAVGWDIGFWPFLIVGTVLGCALPIVLERLVRPHPWPRLLLLGLGKPKARSTTSR